MRQPGHVGPSQPAALPLAYRFACVPSRMTVSSSVRVGRRCCHRILSIRGVAGGMANLKKHSQWPSWRCWRQVRRVFFVTLIPCALSHAFCSAYALVSAAVLGRLASLGFGMNILITRDIRMAPAGCAHECNRSQAEVAHARAFRQGETSLQFWPPCPRRVNSNRLLGYLTRIVAGAAIP